jgi:DUF2917 family protein
MRHAHAGDAPFSFVGRFRQGENLLIGRQLQAILHASRASSKETTMNIALKKPVLALEAGQILTLDDAVGLSILARSGTVWVTEEGSPNDHIVGPGDTLIVAHPGRTLVQALHPAWISLA